MNAKKVVAGLYLGWNLQRFRASRYVIDRLMAIAIELQLGRLTEDEFRGALDECFAGADVESLKDEVGYETQVQALDRPGGYKSAVTNPGATGKLARPGRFDFWGRRYGFLRHLGISCDTVILREGQTIAPHGHCRVVSGFYVLSGMVAVRHYDRIDEYADGLLVRLASDDQFGPGGFSTNSEFYRNIHWLQGLAPMSVLFRVNAVDTPTQTFKGKRHTDSRIYVDPTGEPDASGVITAPFVSEEMAKSLKIPAFSTSQS